MNIEQWDEYKLITSAMSGITETMDESSQMKKMVSHVCNSGGKMIRPIILMLSTDLCGGDPKDSVNAALAIELIHSASLIHDDLLDGGVIRRGIPSAHEKFGHAAAMLCGDFLISKSIELISPFGRNAIRDFGRAGMYMAEGETIDVKSITGKFEVNNYYECIRKKTASLFAASASIGAYIGGADNEVASKCRLYGEHVGTAYQIVDDLLEYLDAQDDKRSTHESMTLPHIYLKQMSHENAVKRSITEVQKQVTYANDILKTFDPCSATDKLLQITNHITIDMLP
ncbi:MAG TPA: polyprenyl synthetase family protein [Methanosarcinaceae archaeon]|nr:polyprenyl synthetase family protein [Methanosarcinaceae archaeon]